MYLHQVSFLNLILACQILIVIFFVLLFNSMLADKLNMSPEEAERWIVNLIRQARLDAKIDSKLGHVVMGTQAVSPYQQLIEKTKAMTIRCQVLSMNIEKKLNAVPQPERAWVATDYWVWQFIWLCN